MVHSAGWYTAQEQYGDAFYFLKKQLLGFALGAAAMFAAGFFPYQKLKKLKWPALILSLVMLALVFVPGLGVENYGATRWIGIGPVTIQPSEIARYGFVLFSAAYAAEDPPRMRTFLGMLPVLGAGAGICLLIILEPNMSVTLCTGMLMLVMLFLGGAKVRHLLVILVPAALAVPVLIAVEPYRLQRLYAFLDPWASPQGEGYQLIQSLYALGNGGWLGTGLFGSVQKYRYLPFAESDFILAVIGEEFGFVGVLLLFFVCGFLVWKGIKTAARADDFFPFCSLGNCARLRDPDARQCPGGQRHHSAHRSAPAPHQFGKYLSHRDDGVMGVLYAISRRNSAAALSGGGKKEKGEKGGQATNGAPDSYNGT